MSNQRSKRHGLCATFAGVSIVTLAEGDITHLHVGLKGTMNALFLKDLADKTRRGLRGRVELVKSGGGPVLRLQGDAQRMTAWRLANARSFQQAEVPATIIICSSSDLWPEFSELVVRMRLQTYGDAMLFALSGLEAAISRSTANYVSHLTTFCPSMAYSLGVLLF